MHESIRMKNCRQNFFCANLDIPFIEDDSGRTKQGASSTK